jgi:SAM-dependent methyltransferase
MTDDAMAIDYFSRDHPLRRWATARALAARKAMFAHFAEAVPFDEHTTVVDIGATPDEALADSNFFEAFYPYPANITATSIEDCSHLERRYPGLRFVRTDGTRLPFDDGAFDVAFCSAVLEHVGDRQAQRRFVTEMTRVARRFYLTTPNRWFPLELHTFVPLAHWLPQRHHQRVLRALGKDFWASIENLNLTSARTLGELFPPGVEVRIDGHRVLGIRSNLIAVGFERAQTCAIRTRGLPSADGAQ